MFEALIPEKWAKWLKASLEYALVCRQLLKAGAAIGIVLLEAVRRGHGEIRNDLLKSRASIATKNGTGNTPLHAAAYHGASEDGGAVVAHHGSRQGRV